MPTRSQRSRAGLFSYAPPRGLLSAGSESTPFTPRTSFWRPSWRQSRIQRRSKPSNAILNHQLPHSRQNAAGLTRVSLSPSLTRVPSLQPFTPAGKIFLASNQLLPNSPAPISLPRLTLPSAGRASAGQHLLPTRRRRKASSNGLPAFRTSVRSPRMGSGRLVDLPERDPLRAPRASTGQTIA